MYIKVSKKMVNELNKALKKRINDGIQKQKLYGMKIFTSSIYKFVYDTCDVRQYELSVDDNLFRAMDYNDYNCITNTFKFIRVIYNDNCFCFDKFITTYELNKIFNTCDKTLDGFINAVFDEFEI